LPGDQLQPGSKILTISATQILRVVNCAPAAVGPEDLAPLVNTCKGIYDGQVVSPATISDWSVNGVVGGNSTIGTISGGLAPASMPGFTCASVPVKGKTSVTDKLAIYTDRAMWHRGSERNGLENGVNPSCSNEYWRAATAF